MTMAGIHAHRLDPKIGNVMAYLSTALLNALETAELERRISNSRDNREDISRLQAYFAWWHLRDAVVFAGPPSFLSEANEFFCALPDLNLVSKSKRWG